jgi:hypothetical protein
MWIAEQGCCCKILPDWCHRGHHTEKMAKSSMGPQDLREKRDERAREEFEVRRLKFLVPQTSRFAFLARLAQHAIEEEFRFDQVADPACRIA